MFWPYTVYLIATFVGAIITFYLMFHTWRQRPAPGATAFAVSMGLATMLSLSCGLSMLSPTLVAARFWFETMFLSFALVPVSWLVFAFQYAGHRPVFTRFRLLLLLIIPLLTQVIVWTNDAHHLFAYYLGDFYRMGPYIVVARDTAILNVWFWVYTTYGYVLMLTAVGLIMHAAMRTFRLYAGQSLLLAIGALIPALCTALTTFGVVTTMDVNLAPLGFTLGGIAFSLAMSRFRLFDVVPVARNVLVDRMSDGVLVLDVQGRIVDLNPVFRAMMGTAPAQLIGMPVEEGAQTWPALLACLADPVHAPCEIALYGHEYDVRISSLHDVRGATAGRLVVLRDVTARKQAELALRRYTQELETSNAELDAFAHTVAHDLKDPLSVMVGYGMLLENYIEAMPPETVRSNLRHLIQTGQKMTDIVNELLLLASIRKIEELEIGLLDMGWIVDEVCGRLAPMISERKAELITPQIWPEVIGYAPWIEEVWVNYINNALKYGGRPAEGVPPRVELGWDRIIPEMSVYNAEGSERSERDVPLINVPSSGFRLRFWVRDNGPGLSEDEQGQLFRLFTQIGTGHGSGHGLGLSIVQRIVYKLAGEVGVESEEGQGSLFWFTLLADASGKWRSDGVEESEGGGVEGSGSSGVKDPD